MLLAMAEFHQGRTDVARQRLKALEGAMARPLWQLRASALYEEACELAGL